MTEPALLIDPTMAPYVALDELAGSMLLSFHLLVDTDLPAVEPADFSVVSTHYPLLMFDIQDASPGAAVLRFAVAFTQAPTEEEMAALAQLWCLSEGSYSIREIPLAGLDSIVEAAGNVANHRRLAGAKNALLVMRPDGTGMFWVRWSRV